MGNQNFEIRNGKIYFKGQIMPVRPGARQFCLTHNDQCREAKLRLRLPNGTYVSPEDQVVQGEQFDQEMDIK